MCAKEGASAVTELVPAIVSNGRRPHAAACQKTSCRARNTAASPLSQIVLDNLPEFERWMKNPLKPPESRPSGRAPLYGIYNLTRSGCGVRANSNVALNFLQLYCPQKLQPGWANGPALTSGTATARQEEAVMTGEARNMR